MYLTKRAIEALESLPADIRSDYVFIDPRTGSAYRDIRKLWTKYREEAGISAETWFHDNRRSYITNARRRGIDERTIMRQSGHKTRAAFDRYNIVDDHDQREAVRKYEAGFSRRASGTPRPGANGSVLGQDLDTVGSEGTVRNDEGPRMSEGLRAVT